MRIIINKQKNYKNYGLTANIYPKCSICGQPPPNGLFDGFRLAGKFICSVCEKQITSLGVSSKEYLEAVNSIKKVLYKGQDEKSTKLC